MPRLLLLALSAALVLLTAPAALAGPPGKWTRLSTANQSNINQPGLARTADGGLHVAWLRPNGLNGGADDLWHTTVAANGTATNQSSIATNWGGISDPALVTEANGVSIRAFFGGIRSGDSGETNNNLNTSISPDRGASWSLQPGTVVAGDSAYTSPMSATRLGGVHWQAWGGAYAHRGLSSATPNIDLQARIGGGCCGYNANIAADAASNLVTAAWYSNSDDGLGVWTQALEPGSGTPIGSPKRMPGSVVVSGGAAYAPSLDDRTPLAARPGGGTYIAYPSGYPSQTRVLLWRVGSPKSIRLAKGQRDIQGTTIAAAPNGRVWVAWSADTKGGRRVLARRSNPAVTRWGKTVAVKPPKGSAEFWSLYADAGTSGRLDVVALVTKGGIATWHSQIKAGLTLSAPKKISRKKKNAKFRVTDAGSPVAGAKVRVGKVKGTTGADGRVTLKLGPFGKKKKAVRAKASRGGYTSTSKKIKLKKAAKKKK